MDDPEGGFMEYIEEIQEQVILVGVQLDENDNVKESLDELEELADRSPDSGKIIQNRETVHPGTYIGKGKIEEVRVLCWPRMLQESSVTMSFPPAQMNNLEHELECKVMDRTLLILGYFLQNMPLTSEGKIQVEPGPPVTEHQTGRTRCILVQTWRRNWNQRTWREKLESDRRLIRKRITALKGRALSQVEHRELLRTGRTRGKMKTGCYCGLYQCR